MKKNFYSIMILMSISLIGISWIQWYWIQHAIKVREQQFDQSIHHAMANIGEKLETQEVLFELKNFTGEDFKYPYSEQLELKKEAIEKEMAASIKDKKTENIVIDTILHFPDDVELRYLQKSFFSKNGTSHDEDIFVIVDSIESANIDIDIIEEMHLNSKKKLTLINNKLGSLEKIFNRIAFEIVEDPKDLSQRLEGLDIDSLIYKTLQDRGIDAKFRYAITDANGMWVKNSETNDFEHDIKTSSFQSNLFPNDISPRLATLSLFFPNKKVYVIQSMWLMLLLSLLFTLTILFSFAASIRMMLRQKKVSEIKTDFINNMTHEFKTPIATISLATDAIRHPKTKNDESKINYYTDIISKENQRMHQQVEQVLRMALLEKDKLEFHFEQLDLHEIISKSCEGLELQLKQKNGNITKQLLAENDTIEGDAIHLRNLICNLIENGIKYSKHDPDILISTCADANGIELCIADKGIGMTKETQKHIFDTFYRRNTGNVHDVKGFGLGLSYVKAIAHIHKAEIRVESEVQKGTKIYVRFPYTQA